MWLSLIRDTNKCDIVEFNWLINELVEIAKILASSILTLKGRKNI